MAPIFTSILLLCLIPAGIFLLIYGIKCIRKSVGGAVVLNVPLVQTEARLTVPKDGNYAIWQKGKSIRQMAAKMPVPDIYNEQTGEKLRLQIPFAVVRTNDGSNGRIRVFTFYASAGQYRYQLPANSGASTSWLQKIRTNDRIDPAKCFIEVKENRPASLLVWGILVVILAAFCIIAGIVFTFNFQTFK